MPSSSCLSEDALANFVERTAEGEELRAASEHVDRCNDCRALLAEWTRHFVPDHEEDESCLVSGSQVDHYLVTRELGRGARGVVYLAKDLGLSREVVLKFAARSNVPGERAALVAEGKTLATLAHPNVVRVFDLGVWRGHVYLAMEAVDGSDLRAWLTREGVRVDKVRRVLRDVASGLGAIHRAGIVHRDVKPENVIVGGDGVARVIDLDLAHRAASERHTRRLDACAKAGTPCYMAPEARAGAAPTASADVFAFCLTALEALGLASPFGGRAAPRAPVDRRLARILRRGLSAAPGKRPTMAELEAALSTPRSRRAATITVSAFASLAATLTVVACAAPSTHVSTPLPPAPVSVVSAPPPVDRERELAPASPAVNAPPSRLPARPDRSSVQHVGVAFPLSPFGDTTTFDRASGARALASVDVSRCSSAFGTPRRGEVIVRFRPAGDVERVTVVGPTGRTHACLTRAFKALRVAPYVGGSTVIMRSFSVVERGDGPR